MRLALPLLLSLLAFPLPGLAASPAGAPARPSGLFPFPIESLTLPNGLKVVFVDFDSPGLAAFYAVVRTGSRNEVEPGRTGFAHFFEHMMFRGTEKYPSQLYEELQSRAGIANNAFTTDDFTAFHAFGPSASLPLTVELEADRFRNLKYPVDDFRTEARAVLGEYNKSFANPARKMSEVMQDTAFTRHTYKHTTMGFLEDIEAMPGLYDYSLEFFRRWYTPDNTTLIVVGDFDRAQIEALLREKFGPWQGQAAAVEIPVEPPQAARRAVHVPWNNPTQPLLMLGWHVPAAGGDFADSALANVLGPYLFGPTSPLYQDLVLDRQLVTGFGGTYWDHRDPSLFGLFASLKDPQGFAPVGQAVEAALAELRAGKVDAKRLAAVVSNQKYGLLVGLDNADDVAGQLASAVGSLGSPEALDALFAQMERIEGPALAAFANRWLVDSNLTQVTLTGPGVEGPPGVPEYRPDPARLKGSQKAGGAQ